MSKSKHVQPTPRVWVGACTLCDGCILAAGHRGKHKVAEMEEEEYEVELILSERRGRAGGGPAPRAARRCEGPVGPRELATLLAAQPGALADGVAVY